MAHFVCSCDGNVRTASIGTIHVRVSTDRKRVSERGHMEHYQSGVSIMKLYIYWYLKKSLNQHIKKWFIKFYDEGSRSALRWNGTIRLDDDKRCWSLRWWQALTWDIGFEVALFTVLLNHKGLSVKDNLRFDGFPKSRYVIDVIRNKIILVISEILRNERRESLIECIDR